ncbi:MAG: Mth938-like domain-containing protein [Parvibaculum sp.]|uniref:Mth938-like domain-containing protein n=1 Tax=Parvibaculum sp. TaxID=2024848 RepID=UPI0025DC19BE|nr:Mth938-like domain-containing protein [Parvibaculum sp.]MCE9649311.1 Mth938-like domain-containing protein [Parvibaculum sp.]
MKPRFDGQPLIDAYGDHGFRLASQRFEGSILLTPRGLYPWSVATLAEADSASLAPLAACADEFDFLIVGGGAGFARFSKNLAAYLANLRIVPDFMDTGAACRTYNVLRSEDRRVAAALIAVA